MYGCESWTINKSMQNKIDATEMWFLRRMLKISYLDRITNKEVLQRAKTSKALMKYIKKQQSKFTGHTMRQRSLEHLGTTGKIEGKRSRGCPAFSLFVFLCFFPSIFPVVTRCSSDLCLITCPMNLDCCFLMFFIFTHRCSSSSLTNSNNKSLH